MTADREPLVIAQRETHAFADDGVDDLFLHGHDCRSGPVVNVATAGPLTLTSSAVMCSCPDRNEIVREDGIHAELPADLTRMIDLPLK